MFGARVGLLGITRLDARGDRGAMMPSGSLREDNGRTRGRTSKRDLKREEREREWP